MNAKQVYKNNIIAKLNNDDMKPILNFNIISMGYRRWLTMQKRTVGVNLLLLCFCMILIIISSSLYVTTISSCLCLYFTMHTLHTLAEISIIKEFRREGEGLQMYHNPEMHEYIYKKFGSF